MTFNMRFSTYAKMGSIKDRNGVDLTEAEDIKKRWQKYTEELYKKDLHDPEIESTSLISPVAAGRFFTTSTIWEAQICQ